MRNQTQRAEKRGQDGKGRERSGGESRNKCFKDGRPICNKCSRPGHIDRNCYIKLREEKEIEGNANKVPLPSKPPKPDPEADSSSDPPKD